MGPVHFCLEWKLHIWKLQVATNVNLRLRINKWERPGSKEQQWRMKDEYPDVLHGC